MPKLASFLCAAPQARVLCLGSLPGKHASLSRSGLILLFLMKTLLCTCGRLLALFHQIQTMPMKAGVHQKGIWSDVVFFFRLANTGPLFANMHQAKLIFFKVS